METSRVSCCQSTLGCVVEEVIDMMNGRYSDVERPRDKRLEGGGGGGEREEVKPMGEATDRGGAASAPHGGWVEEGRGRARGLSRTDGGGGDRDESDGGDVAAGIT